MRALIEIEKRHSITLPMAYRDWCAKRYTDPTSRTYLWVFEAEWIPPTEVLSHDLWRDRLIPGLIPFAFTGAGDHWCWNSREVTGENEYEVLCCWHDEELADVYAPTFASWFYRTCLDYASGGIDDEPEAIREAGENFRGWAEVLAGIDQPQWASHLRQLAITRPTVYQNPLLRVPSFGSITDMEVDAIVSAQMGARYVRSKAEWGWYDDD